MSVRPRRKNIPMLRDYGLVGFLTLSSAMPLGVSTAQAQGLLGRPSPPQPQQKQGVEYFVGTWTMTWTGRESAITAGPRTGKATYTRVGDSPRLTAQVEGTIDGGGPFRESSSLDWNADAKSLAIREQIAGGAQVTGAGDWSSPIAIRYESQPVTVGGQTLRLRRLYSIVSGSSFQVTEEISVNGGAYQRLGTGDYRKE